MLFIYVNIDVSVTNSYINFMFWNLNFLWNKLIISFWLANS